MVLKVEDSRNTNTINTNIHKRLGNFYPVLRLYTQTTEKERERKKKKTLDTHIHTQTHTHKGKREKTEEQTLRFPGKMQRNYKDSRTCWVEKLLLILRTS